MQGGKNWILPKETNANRFFWDSHWLEIWSNHFFPSMGKNGGSVAMDSELQQGKQEAEGKDLENQAKHLVDPKTVLAGSATGKARAEREAGGRSGPG